MIHLVTEDECLYGTKQVPPKKKWKPCCESFESHTSACQYEVRLEWYKKAKEWGIPIPLGGGYIKISFCPFCGKSLDQLKQEAENARH